MLTAIGLAGTMLPAWAQYESIAVGDSCSYFGESMPYSVTSFRSDAEAEKIIADILDHSGLRPNFKIHAAGVPNAAAAVRFGKRYILYNQRFMRDMRSRTGSKWAAISIMAHEIGHHLQGHTLEDGGSRPSTELEADEYSGAMIQKIGGSLNDALVAMNTIGSDYGSRTHPAKRDRLAAITSGYIRSEQLGSGGRRDESRNSTVSTGRDSDIRCESHGEWVEKNRFGIAESGYILNGKKCGEWSFDFGREKIFVANFKGGKKNGHSVLVCEFERCTYQGNYKNDKKDGKWNEVDIFSDTNGEIRAGNYRNNQKHGRWEVTRKIGYVVTRKTEVYRHGILFETIRH